LRRGVGAYLAKKGREEGSFIAKKGLEKEEH